MKKYINLFLALLILFNFSTWPSCSNEIAEESESEKPKLERHFVFDSIPMNLEEIEKRADRIFGGVCTGKEEIESDSVTGGLPTIKYTFKITDSIKGVKGKKEITFRQWSATVRSAGFETGKKYVLFLYPDSSRNLTSTVGVDGQGLFEVEKRGIIRRSEIVSNKLKNHGLSRNLKSQKKINIEQDKSLNDYIERCSELGIPISYKQFIKAVRYLAEKNN
jgi:hypothetical protein